MMGVYRPVIRYVGFEFLGTVVVSVLGSAGLITLSAFILKISMLPRSILIIDSFITLILAVGARIYVRWLLFILYQ